MSVHLANERNTVLDVTGVKDASGAAVVLKPKGEPGSSRECDKAVLENPTVQKLLASGWISSSRSAPAETPVAAAPPETPAPVVPPPAADSVEVVSTAETAVTPAASDDAPPSDDGKKKRR